MTELKLPSLGEGIEKGTIISISVKVGDTIATEQTLMEVETDKVVVEVPADAAGTVTEILVNTGDEIAEGTPILKLSSDETAEKEQKPVAISAEEEAAVRTLIKDSKVENKTLPKVAQKPLVSNTLKLPSLGEGIEKGMVISIQVKSGDTVVAEQTLMEVETDKVVVEVPSDVSGTIEEVLVAIGEEIGEGTPIIKLKSAESTQQGEDEKLEVVPPKAIRTEDPIPVKNQANTTEATPTNSTNKKGKFRASPLARKMAREIGIDITMVTLSNGRSRISVNDVKEYSKALNTNRTKNGTPSVEFDLPDFSKWGSIHKEHMSSIAQATSKNMTITWSQVPHAWLQEKVDITDLEAKRQEHKHQIKAKGGALTITSILVKVLAKALEEFPVFNTSLDTDANEIIYKDYIHIGVAVDSDRGLMVPIIRDADQKGILEISQDLVSLSQSVKEKKIKPEELQGGTFTISNLGGIGTSAIFPLVNHPQTAILGVAASQTEAVWRDGNFEPRLRMPLTIGFDHRIINGADAARFLKYVKTLLEDWFLWNL
ncbi:2-oxo acid dehydrogenase subunit E2 [Maribacter sp. 2210JD10-5]|uniref:2-oxo acid dehydrogenase subunit E2 n=1 Tax=Maribacter sp. 2210JD10-5 TaxID=3386272 RepID=UPI0039BD1D27